MEKRKLLEKEREKNVSKRKLTEKEGEIIRKIENPKSL